MATRFTITLSREAFNALAAGMAGTTDMLPRLEVEVGYFEDIGEEGAEDAPADVVPRSLRAVFTSPSDVALDVGTPVGQEVALALLRSDGTAASVRTVRAEQGEAKYTITTADVKALIEAEVRPDVPVSVRIARAAQFVAIGNVRPDFKRLQLGVRVVNDAQELSANDSLGAFGFTADRSSAVELTPAMADDLRGLSWSSVHLGVDGRFTAVFEQPVAEDGQVRPSLGWVWWLNGEQAAAGFVKDSVSAPDRMPRTIPLPALQATPTPPAAPGKDDCSCNDRSTTVSADVTEAELVNNPGVYTEDPGTFCKPFSNPERVIGEKAFAVIARVQQPDISPLPSARLRSQELLDVEPDDDVTVKPDPRGGNIVVLQPPKKEMVMAALLNARAPKRVLAPVNMRKEVALMPSGRTEVSAEHPVQWEDDIAQYQAATVALGHILEFRVRTRSNGYSLGNVASTLTLAPRQTKRIQKVEFERLERARRDEVTQQTDSVNDEVARERDYDDNVSAYLREWATGSSSSGTAAAAGGFGFAIPPIVGGVGGGTSKAWSESTQEGTRNTGASEQQRLRDAIRRHGDAVRRLQSTVVTEVTQQETVTGTTEVLRNPNYGHSLTVIYYQILRHLAVSTEFAGVRECLFVPFAIKPFTLQRTYRWREAIRRYLRVPKLAKAMQHLRDVITDFEHSDIAAGTRAMQPLTYLRGSIYITLAIERPKDTDDGKYDPARWLPYATYFGTPAYGIWAKLMQVSEAARDQKFQNEHAPIIAAKWTDQLKLVVDGKPVHADCTLATGYGFNRTVRVDFNMAPDQADGLTRMQLRNTKVVAATGLPPGSVANVTHMTMRYGTATFERTISATSGVDDLVKPESGERDLDGAGLVFSVDAWENVDEQKLIRNSVSELLEHLNEHVEFYHKAIWWSMDRDRLLMMLDGFHVPGSKNVSIASVVDREPVAIIGNALVYRVGAGAFLGYGKITTPAELYDQYAGREPVQDPLLISLPTDGLYAQTIMDECLALEEHQGNVDWVLNDPDPELGTIDPSLMMSRREDVSGTLTPTQMPATIINLQNAPDAPAPTGLQGALAAVGNAGAFRDMAGLAGTQANAAAALQSAASLATNFGNQAAALKMAETASKAKATEDVNRQLAAVQKAKDQGLISDEKAAEHTDKILGGMHEGGSGSDSVITGQDLAQQLIDSGKGGSIAESTPGGTRVVDIPAAVFASDSGGGPKEPDTDRFEVIFGLDITLCTQKIFDIIDKSPIVNHSWKGGAGKADKGKAPLGYLRGMAWAFARVYCKMKAGDQFATAIAKARTTGSGDTDALAMTEYETGFTAVGMANDVDGADTLRHVFTLLTSLGMRESGGKFCAGVDTTAASSNTARTAEAGVMQMSFSLLTAGSDLEKFHAHLKTIPYKGLKPLFAIGVRGCGAWSNVPAAKPAAASAARKGWDFQEFCKAEPALGVELAALGLRQRRKHWGPVCDGDLEINVEWEGVLADVQAIVETESCCSGELWG